MVHLLLRFDTSAKWESLRIVCTYIIHIYISKKCRTNTKNHKPFASPLVPPPTFELQKKNVRDLLLGVCTHNKVLVAIAVPTKKNQPCFDLQRSGTFPKYFADMFEVNA